MRRAQSGWPRKLVAHNAYRERLGLRKLVWSDKLAKAAQAWADKLIKRSKLEHQQLPSTGENLFEMTGGGATPDDVVHDWASESLDYDYASNRCHSMCGHYTQVVWRNTHEVDWSPVRSAAKCGSANTARQGTCKVSVLTSGLQ